MLTDSKLTRKHPILGNIFIIVAVALLGLLIAYFSLALFTKHGRTRTVPGVENMSYTEAVETLHDKGFRVEIRDSLYLDDVRPGYVVEQFPKRNSVVKPGRKIFLYINAVHPKEVVIDEDRHPMDFALKGVAYRQAIAHLEELGFKHIKVVYVLGGNKDNVVRIIANGRVVRKTQKVPVNAHIVVEINDGRLLELYDSLMNADAAGNYIPDQYEYPAEPEPDPGIYYPEPETPEEPATPDVEPEEEPETIGL